MTLSYALNPLRPPPKAVPVPMGASLTELAPARSAYPYYCTVNGLAVMRSDWSGRRVGAGDTVAFIGMLPLPQGGGGGGGGGGKNPLATVAMLAVMVFNPGAALAGEGFLGLSGFAAKAVGMAINAAIGMAVTALTMETPKANAAQQMQSLAAPSPTYDLNAQGNQARLGQPIPEHFGRHINFPNFAAEPYAEYAGNEQFLYQLLCIGRGEYDVEAVRIGDTAIASFPEISYEILAPGEPVTLFPAAVTTSEEVSGQELTTGDYIGPFVANAAGTEANALGVDVVFPKGLYYANSGGGLDSKSGVFVVEARMIDGAGAAIAPGTWSVLGTTTTTAATTTPQRISARYDVAPGRYEVRVKRTDTKDAGARAGHDLIWSGLRAYLYAEADYGDVTLLALRMRASNSLSGQSSRLVNVIATRKLPTWSELGGWTAPVATRSIAWAFAYVGAQRYDDARLPLAELEALDTTWTARGDTFDGIFDSKGTAWEALQQIARAGRAKPYPQGGLLRIARDEPQSTPAAIYSMRNILPDSFALDYTIPSEATADAVEVEFFNEDTWKWDRVTAKLAGSSGLKPAKVRLFGVTQRDQAWREGMFIAAGNKYRRRAPSWRTGMEGMIPSYLDLVLLQHDLPEWGQQAEAVAWDAGTRDLEVSEPLTFAEAGTHYVGLRRLDGSFAGPYVATAGADAYRVILATDPAITPYTGDAQERTHVVFGLGATGYARECRLISAKPVGEDAVELRAVVEDSRVHTADESTPPPADGTWLLDAIPSAPVVSGLYWVVTGIDEAPRWNVSCRPAAGATRYLVEESPDGELWTRVGEPEANNLSFSPQWPGGQVRMAAIGKTLGPWVTKTTPDKTRTTDLSGAMDHDSDTPGLLVPTPYIGDEAATFQRAAWAYTDYGGDTSYTDMCTLSFDVPYDCTMMLLTRSAHYAYTIGSTWNKGIQIRVDWDGGYALATYTWQGKDVPPEMFLEAYDIPAGTVTVTYRGYFDAGQLINHRIAVWGRMR